MQNIIRKNKTQTYNLNALDTTIQINSKSIASDYYSFFFGSINYFLFIEKKYNTTCVIK